MKIGNIPDISGSDILNLKIGQVCEIFHGICKNKNEYDRNYESSRRKLP